jgi:putative inorganic carbon (HCO3(-)) transporter
MGARDILVTAIVFGALPVCFARPWIGILVWSWLGYMSPHRLTYGFAYTMPFALLVAVATLLGLIFARDRRRVPRTVEVFLLMALWLYFLLTTIFANYQDDAWNYLSQVSKILLMTFVTMILFQDAARLRWLLVVMAGSIAFFGVKGGVWALATGGENRVFGPPDSFIADNNSLGLALNMVIPLLFFLRRTAEGRWRRRAFFGAAILCIVAVPFTYSRGAVVGLAVVLPLLLLTSRWRFAIIPFAIIVYLFGPSLMKSAMPDPWIDRMDTIQTYEEDTSANQRLKAWLVAYRLALEHPIVGGGFRTFTSEVHARYVPDSPSNAHDAHSIYFQVLGEHGFVGLGLYVALLITTMISLRRLVVTHRRDSSRGWIAEYAAMLEVSLAAFLVSGAFLSVSYFDLFFHFVAIVAILKQLSVESIPTPIPTPSRTPARRAMRVGLES